MDVNYWKDAYKHLWVESSKKEEFLRNIILQETGLELEPYGFGAESNEYISGSAQENSSEKNSPDYKVKGINIFIEVTGPLNDYTRPQSGLWIRPGKLRYAYEHIEEAEEFFALYFPVIQEWYVIHANKEFFDDIKKQKNEDYKKVYPVIRGKPEKCIEIKYNNPFVKDLGYLISFLNQKVTKE